MRAHGQRAAAIDLAEAHGCPDWWSQMVTVGYEQEQGLRRKHEKLADEAAAATMKAYWAEALERLRVALGA